MRANTVLAGSKLKLERFVMLLWNFTERGKSYQQISNAANLPPQAHYVEDKLSPNSIANFIIILLSHFHFCHIKICFRYRNSNASSKSPGDGGRGLGRHELNCFADNSFVNQNVNKFSVFFVNQMVYYIFAPFSGGLKMRVRTFYCLRVEAWRRGVEADTWRSRHLPQASRSPHAALFAKL